MQATHASFQLPQYQSALLKRQRQSKVLSPKVTHVYPEISSIQKLKLKKHHLDDTEMKLALQYDYEDNHLPKQYLFRGDRVDYDRGQYNSGKKGRRRASGQGSNGFVQMGAGGQGNLKLNTEYFETQQHFNPYSKPQRDQDPSPSHRQYQTHLQNYSNQPPSSLKKSISSFQLQSLRNDHHHLQQKLTTKLNNLQTQTDRITKNIQHIQNSKQSKQKSASSQNDPMIARYRSEGKGEEADRKFGKLKEKLERERTKEKKRLEAELGKIKEETRRIKQEERKRKKSFKEIMDRQQQKQPNSKYLENLMLSAASNHAVPINSLRMNDHNYISQTMRQKEDNMIGEKISELQRKYLPKTNIVNKRIQCEIYDPKSDHLRRLQEKPKFMCDDHSDTDSQFSDF